MLPRLFHTQHQYKGDFIGDHLSKGGQSCFVVFFFFFQATPLPSLTLFGYQDPALADADSRLIVLNRSSVAGCSWLQPVPHPVLAFLLSSLFRDELPGEGGLLSESSTCPGREGAPPVWE